MRKIALILAAALLSLTQSVTLDGQNFMKVKHSLSQTEAETETQTERPVYASCTFYSNDNIPPVRIAETTSLIPAENIAGTVKFTENDGADYV